MKPIPLILLGLLTLSAQATENEVRLPTDDKSGVRYSTDIRSNIREETYISREAIETVQQGKPVPNETVITMEDYRDDKLYRYVVMENQAGWGKKFAANIRTGDWQFQSFAPKGEINRNENV